MGFADRNSLAGRTSSVTFPDAIKRNGSSNTATRLEVQLTDSNGSPNDPDSSLVYVRVTNEAGTASDSLLYTDAAMSSAATNSTNATYNNGSSAFWKMVTTSGGKITLYHKTGTASSVEGSFVLEIAWFENSSAVATSHPFRIVDAADLDTMAANIDSVLEDTGTTLPSTLSSISSAVGALNDASSAGNADAVWDEAMSGHTSSGTAGKALADVLADTAALDGAWADGGRLDVILDAALADTNELQGDWTDGGRLDAILDSVLADTATLGAPAGASHAADVAAVKTVVDTILVDTSTTLDDFIDTEVAAILADTATLGSPAGASHAADNAAIKAVVDGVATAVSAVQNNTRFVATVPPKLNRESAAVAIKCFLYDTAGNMEDADSNEVFVKISQMDGSAVANRYYSNSGLSSAISAEGSGTFSGYYQVPRSAAGLYSFFYKNDAAHTEENLIVEFGWVEGSSTIYQSRAMQISDAADLDDIVADTNELQGDWTNGGRLDLILDAVLADTATLGAAAGASHAADNAAIKTVVDSILTDTATLGSPAGADHATDIAAIKTVVDTILVDTSTTLDDFIDTEVAAILADTATLGSPAGASHAADNAAIKAETAAILEDTGTTLPAAIAALNDPSAANNADAIWDETMSGHVASGTAGKMLADILADTAALDGAWADGGRLDLILDAVLADTATLGAPAGASHAADNAAIKTVVDSILTDTGTTLNNLIDTEVAAILADTATLGAPAGASHAADIAAIKADTAAILTDTSTTLDDLIDTEVAAILADTNELQGDWADGGRLDLLLDKAAQSVHHATMKRYLKNDTTVMSSDPSDDAVACSSTTQSTTYVVLDVLPVILDEGSDATFTDVFAVLKWLHQGTNNGGGGAVTTKWMISGAAETAGSAPSGSAVTITGETTGNTTANTSSMSGLLTTTALAALASAANGQLRFLLCGKVADARDTCTGRVYKSTSAEISYQV
jgi:hypothetical protein